MDDPKKVPVPDRLKKAIESALEVEYGKDEKVRPPRIATTHVKHNGWEIPSKVDLEISYEPPPPAKPEPGR